MIYLATNDGVLAAEWDGELHIARRSLAGRRITGLAARGETVLAGTEQGLFRSVDGGRAWSEASAGLSIPYVRWLAFHPQIPGLALAGTEPAGIFLSAEDGAAWQARPEVARLREEHGWSLPYSPRAGCVRGFAFHGRRIYAAVEVGGVLVSDDAGATWALAGGSSGSPSLHAARPGWIHPDLHSIEVHPSSADLVYAPTGGGFYRSQDGGRTWELRYACYCRAVWIDPADPDHLVLGPADHVDANGRIEATRDGGATWQAASAGLDTPWPRHMVERFARLGETLFAVLSNGRLLVAPLDSLEWRETLPGLTGVNAAAV